MVTVKVTGPPGSSRATGDADLSIAIDGSAPTVSVSVAVSLSGFGSAASLVTLAVFVWSSVVEAGTV
jgi:hypothetical protein